MNMDDGDSVSAAVAVAIALRTGQQWQTIASRMPQKRSHAAGVIIDGYRFVLVGGMDEEDNRLSSLCMYDSRTKQWTLLPNSMPTARWDCAAVLVRCCSTRRDDGLIYIVGGCNGDGDPVSDLIAFDTILATTETRPTTCTRRKDGKFSLAPMRKRRSGCAAVVAGRYIYIFGGRDSYIGYLNSAERYDIDNNQWEDLPVMSVERSSCAAAILENKIYVMGGENEENVSLGTMEVFDVLSQKWIDHASIPKMLTPRHSCAAVAIAVNRVIVVIGGQDEDYKVSSRAEVYDTRACEWKVLQQHAEMSVCRNGPAVGIFFDGNLVVAGGETNDYVPLNSAEEIWLGDYRRLKQGGTRLLKEDTKWPDALLVEVLIRFRNDPNLMYTFLREKPALFKGRQKIPIQKSRGSSS